MTLGEKIYPAAELSEQISLAGLEASGTGNMKFALNGAVTIGTLDGANIEIREAVGADHFFLFGLTSQQVERTRKDGYDPRAIYEANDELREVIDLIASGFFSLEDRSLFKPLTDSLLTSDPFRVLADYASYTRSFIKIADAAGWIVMAVLFLAAAAGLSAVSLSLKTRPRDMPRFCRRVTMGSSSEAFSVPAAIRHCVMAFQSNAVNSRTTTIITAATFVNNPCMKVRVMTMPVLSRHERELRK